MLQEIYIVLQTLLVMNRSNGRAVSPSLDHTHLLKFFSTVGKEIAVPPPNS